jgi:hypothetical protein
LLIAGILALGLVISGCGDDDDESGAGEGEEIVINTRVEIDTPQREAQKGATTGRGRVLQGSSIGDSPFCPGGTFRDRHGSEDPSVPPYELVDRRFRCPDGSLRIGFTPGVPQGDTQSGPWRVVSGTGAYEGLQGDGEMEIRYDPGSRASGRETFTGTVRTP